MSGSAFDFPANPIVGDRYTTPTNVTYEFTGKVWNQTGSSLEFGIGLKQTGLVVDLQPAGSALTTDEIGGVRIAARAVSNLEVDTQGYLSAPKANHDAPGVIEEPRTGGVPHSRVRDATTGAYSWQPNPDGLLFGIGLDAESTPGTVHLQIAGRGATVDEIGGVRVPLRTPQQGLELDTQGFISAPLATHQHAGSIVDTPPDDAAYSRKTNTQGVSSWIANPAALDFRIGLDDTTTPGIVDLKVARYDELGGVKIQARDLNQGLDLDGNGFLTAPLATNQHAGSIVEPPNDGATYGRSRSTAGVSKWVPGAAATDYGIGLTLEAATATDNQIVNLTPAGLAPQFLGGVWVPPRGALNGLDINDPANPGMLVAPPATSQLAGVITEPPVGAGQLWARTNSGAVAPAVEGKWEPVFNIGTLTYKGAWKPATNDPNIHAVANKQAGDFWVVDCVDPMIEETPPVGSTPGLDGVMVKEGDWVIWNEGAQVWNHIVRQGLNWGVGLEQTGLTIDLQPARYDELGGVKIQARDLNQGLDLDGNGFLTAPLATNQHAGSIVEPVNDGKAYARSRSTAGISTWVEAAAILDFRIGLDDTTTPGIVDLKVARYDELGGVKVQARDLNQGLDLDSNGFLTAPLATNQHAGSIVEPPNDDTKKWMRQRNALGISAWVEADAAKIAGKIPADIGVIYIPDDRGLNLGADGQVSLRPCSATALGGIFDAPMDARAYIRKLGQWEPQQDVTIALEPPQLPEHGQLWWDNDQGGLYIFYTDPTDTQGQGQWVQINGSGGGSSLTATYGDVKQGFQPTDHAGWVKLDGRAVNTLTPGQQNTATALGFTTNLPNATGSVLMQNGGVMGAVSGSMSKTIALANLPAHNMTAASAGAHTHTTDNVGGHEHPGEQSTYGSATPTTESVYDRNYPTETRGAHAHVIASAGAHTHTVALGGSGTALNVTPMSMAVNCYVFLGP